MILPRVLVFVAAWIFSSSPVTAQTKELHWQSLDVRAHLDADGALHVRETQAIVFNGDWNGGERRFSIREGQRLTLERLIEKDASGNTLRELQSRRSGSHRRISLVRRSTFCAGVLVCRTIRRFGTRSRFTSSTT